MPFAGVVQSGGNLPLRGVQVELKSLSDESKVATYTNAAGLFKFELAEGKYQITAKSGTQTVSEERQVVLGKNWIHLSLNEPARRINSSTISVARLHIPRRARKAFDKARRALKLHDLAAVIRHLGMAIELDPRYVEALTSRSILERDSNPEEAVADAERAIRYDPNYAPSYVAKASAYTALGKFDEAIRLLDRGIVLDPASWLGYYEMSRALLCRQDYAAALGYLEIASALAPKPYPFLRMTRAEAFSGLHDNSAARRELEAYLREAPQGDQVLEARQKLGSLDSSY